MTARLSELHVEKRRISSYADLTKDITKSLYENRVKSVVITDKPLVLLSIVSKDWKRMTRKLQKARSSTLDARKLLELTSDISWMQQVRFSAKARTEDLEIFNTDVLFAAADELLRWVPECGALYVTYPIAPETLHQLTVWMHKESLVVIYEHKP